MSTNVQYMFSDVQQMSTSLWLFLISFHREKFPTPPTCSSEWQISITKQLIRLIIYLVAIIPYPFTGMPTMCQGFRIPLELPFPYARGFIIYLKNNISPTPTISPPPNLTWNWKICKVLRKSCVSILVGRCGRKEQNRHPQVSSK